jgi:hypothetical protein
MCWTSDENTSRVSGALRGTAFGVCRYSSPLLDIRSSKAYFECDFSEGRVKLISFHLRGLPGPLATPETVSFCWAP